MTSALAGRPYYGGYDHAALLDELARLRRMKADLDAFEIECLASIATQPDPYADGTPELESKHFVREDVAATLRITSGAARDQLESAARLAALFPATLLLVRDGRIPGYYARRLAEDTTVLGDLAALRVEAAVLPKAPDQTFGQFCRALTRAIKKVDTRPTPERQERSRADRRMHCTPPDTDGMD